jgi:hypothetical protein
MPVLAGIVTLVFAGIAPTAGLNADGNTVHVLPPLSASAPNEPAIVVDEFTLVDSVNPNEASSEML